MSTKNKTKQQSTNQYQYMQAPTTPQQSAFDQSINTFDQPDASIPFTFGNMKEDLNNRFDTPYGADYSPEVKDAILSAGSQNIDQMQGAAIRDDNMRRKQMKSGLLGQSAGMVQPNLVQTGGTSLTTQSQPLLPSLISAGAGLGSAFLT